MKIHHVGALGGGEITGSGVSMLKKCGIDTDRGRLTDNGTLFDQRIKQTLPAMLPFELVEPPSRDTGLTWSMNLVDDLPVIDIGSENVEETSNTLKLLGLASKDGVWHLPRGVAVKITPSVHVTKWHLGLYCEERDDIASFLRNLPDNPLRDQFISQIPPRARKPRVPGKDKERSGSYPISVGGLKVELMFGPNGLHSHGYSIQARFDDSLYWKGGKKQ